MNPSEMTPNELFKAVAKVGGSNKEVYEIAAQLRADARFTDARLGMLLTSTLRGAEIVNLYTLYGGEKQIEVFVYALKFFQEPDPTSS